MTPTTGSHALLLQLTTNLVQNAIVHNLPEHGTVWVTTSVHPKSVMLTVENTGEKLTPQLVATFSEPFLRGTERIRTDHAGVGVGLGLAIVKSITQAHDGTLTLTPRAAGGLRVTVQLPAVPHRTLADRSNSECVRR
jgi:two-component system sensor histidine kinase VanS